MDWTVCSREMERDYTWDDTHASHLVSEYVKQFFAPAFEGSVTNSRFVTLLRCPNPLKGIILSVSASTDRRDLYHTSIRTIAVLRAVTPEETDLLARFFAECLRKPDAETIYNAESGVAKAVESLYQTKKLDDFMQFCRSLPAVNGSGVKLTDRWSIPRCETEPRRALAESLPALIVDNTPFLLALTDRLPTDVLSSLGSMFDHAVVRIFSKAIPAPEKLPVPASQKHRRAAAIGGAAILAAIIVALDCGEWSEVSTASASKDAFSKHSSRLRKLELKGNVPSSSGRKVSGKVLRDCNNWERTIPVDRPCALWAVNVGQAVCAENGGRNPLVANRQTCGGSWETFIIVNNDDGSFSLKSAANDKFVSAFPDGRMIAQGPVVDAREKFDLKPVQGKDGVFTLWSRNTQKYVSVDENKENVLIADRDVADTWEEFRIFCL